MKLRTREKVDPNGEIIIPKGYLNTMGLNAGEEVELRLAGGYLRVEPVKEAVAHKKKHLKEKDPVEALVGVIPLNDPKLIDEIVESEEVYG